MSYTYCVTETDNSNFVEYYRHKVSIYDNYISAAAYFLQKYLSCVDYAINDEEIIDEYNVDEDNKIYYKCSCNKKHYIDFNDIVAIKQLLTNILNKIYMCPDCKDNIQIYIHPIKTIIEHIENNKSYGHYECGNCSISLEINISTEPGLLCRITL